MLDLVNFPKIMRPAEAVVYLQNQHGLTVAERTLAKWRTVGGGPRFLKNGLRRVLYPVAELDAWAVERLGAPRSSTSSPEAGAKR